jgi:WD40 repeat protein
LESSSQSQDIPLAGEHRPFAEFGQADQTSYALAFDATGRRLAASNHRKAAIEIWDAASVEMKQSLHGHQGRINDVAFQRKGDLLASGGEDHVVRLWSLNTGASLRELQGHTGSVLSVVFSPDGERLLSTSADGTVILWDVPTGAKLKSGDAADSDLPPALYDADFHPGGAQFAVADNNLAATVWDTATFQRSRALIGAREPLRTVAYSPDGRRIVSATSKRTYVWDAESGQMVLTLAGMSRARFSPDGQRIFTGSPGATVIVWDALTGDELMRLPGLRAEDRGANLAISPDGLQVVLATDRQGLRLWEADPLNSPIDFPDRQGETKGD